MPKFLSQIESQEWLDSFGVTITRNRDLIFNAPDAKDVKTIAAQLPTTSLKLTAILERTVDWLPRAKERLLWHSDWATYPPHPFEFFDSVRKGYGEHRSLIEKPGCLFKPDNGEINQEFSKEPDTSILIGMSLLVMNFDWSAYLVVRDDTARVFLGDELISFCTQDSAKLDEARELLRRFGLKFRQIE